MKIDITFSSILKVVFIVLLLWLVFAVRDIAVMLFIVFILASALNPLVKWASKYIPRTLAVILIYLIILSAFVGLGYLIMPPLVAEIKQLAINLPIILAKFLPYYQSVQGSISTYQESLLNLSSQVGKLTGGIFAGTVGLISGILAFVTILIMTFYKLLEKNDYNYFYNFFAESKREHVQRIAGKITEKMGQWFGGQLILMLTIGICYAIVLSVLGVPYALILAIWGGLTEIIPYLGPWLGLIPAVLIAFTISPWAALIVLISYLVIQQLESMILVPKIMGKAVGLSPVVVILAMLIGGKLMGILGIVIAVPLAAAISVIVQEWPEISKIFESE